jgi:hypothetical protein
MDNASAWYTNWAWGLPLIVLTVIFHVIGLGLFNVRVHQFLARVQDHRRYDFLFAVVMGVTTMWATFLLAIDAGAWAIAFRWLGALPDSKAALLYSLSAITTYGHSEIFLAPNWRLLGALEALNGIMLFGLTTAFMYGMIQLVWPIERRRHGHSSH